MAVKKLDIPEAKIRQALWMVKTNKTKKSICEHLGIAYNTKRMDAILQEFKDKEERIAQLKKKSILNVFSAEEKTEMAKAYQDGESISSISTRNYISSQKVKSFLIELGVPIRGRARKAPAKTDHVIQDLDIKFKKGDRVFHGPSNSFAIICNVLDENYVEYLKYGNQKYVELHPFNPNPKTGMAGKYFEPAQDVHYQIYWTLEDGKSWKLDSLKRHISKVETHIEEHGRESYDIQLQGDYVHGRSFVPRDQLFPVIRK